jgi:hypothetical protein
MQTQTLSLKRTIKGLTIVGYLGANATIYTDKCDAIDSIKKQVNNNKVDKLCDDVKKLLKYTKLMEQIKEAKRMLKSGWSFTKYCLLCSLYKALRLFRLSCDNLQRAMLF